MIDADGLWHLIHSPSLIRGYSKAVLTPNAMEFCRLGQTVLKRPDMKPDNDPNPELVNEVARALGGVTIVHKGSTDVISNGRHVEKCLDEGSPRRYVSGSFVIRTAYRPTITHSSAGHFSSFCTYVSAAI